MPLSSYLNPHVEVALSGQDTITNRQFVELGRAKLDADGYLDIEIKRQ